MPLKCRIFDKGSGPPVVVVPGVHGRWEWMQPALHHLSASCRVISYSLCGDLGSGRRADGFESYIRQLEDVFHSAGLERAAVCGVSFGGFIALRYTAQHADQVNALILASAPAPGWQPSSQQAGWIERPWLSAPVFVASAPLRLWPEVRAAYPDFRQRVSFLARQGLRAAAAPMIPGLMAKRVREAVGLDFTEDCTRISVPTLVVTGEEALDGVVPVTNTRAYTRLIPNARYEPMPGTGHLGLLTQPDRFAALVSAFVHAHHL